MTALPEVLRDFQGLQEVIYGAVLIVCVVVMPGGIAGLLQHWGLLPAEAMARHWRALPRPAAPPPRIADADGSEPV